VAMLKVRVLAGAAAAIAVVLSAAGCSGAPPDPFEFVYGTGVGPWVAQPGWQLGYLFGDANNLSHQTLTIQSASLRGPGVGTVVKVSVMIAPLTGGRDSNAGGGYPTTPPVGLGVGGCHTQLLVTPRGYRVKPGGQFRLWAVVTAVRPGRWKIPQQVITYTENGGTYQHVFPIYYWGTVTATATMNGVADPSVAPCVNPEHAHYLRYYHA
jgi:hypothetical protein